MKISMRGLVWLSMILLTVAIIACSIIFNFWRWLVVFYAITLLLTAYFFYRDAKCQKQAKQKQSQSKIVAIYFCQKIV